MHFVLLIAAFLLSGYAWSQQPMKSNATKAANQSKNSEQSQYISNPTPPTLASSLSVRITEPAIIKVEAVPDEEARKRERDDLKAQQDQAEWAEILAWLAGATATLLIYQNYLLRIQVRGARAEFIATHRPRLKVRQVSLITPDGHQGGIAGAQFMVVNVGDSPAKVIEVCSRLWVTQPNENLPATPPYEGITHPNVLIVPGEATSFSRMESEEVSSHSSLVDGFMRIAMGRHQGEARSGMLLLGYVVYEDGNGIKRRTAFLREYRYDVLRFEPIPHPDYEYQD